MSKVKMEIWGREFNLEVFYKNYKGREITDNQIASYEKFIAADDAIEKSKKKLIAYIEENYEEAGKIENIFKYVIPKMVYIPREEKQRKSALLCDFRFDMEHGLALVFENEKFKEVVSQDDIL